MDEIQHAPTCSCLDAQYTNQRFSSLTLHTDQQDNNCDGWKRLCDLVEEAAIDGSDEFAPLNHLTPEERHQVITLPPTIAKLKDVKSLNLYGSSLVRIPTEIGEMTSLSQFTPYTSYRLHWFPYEITRCRKLTMSIISTRALYGNFKYRPPFPDLPQLDDTIVPRTCSVCDGPFSGSAILQFWISLMIATDVVPLLVHACSEECIQALPAPAKDYIRVPHLGGFGLEQPPTRF